MKHILSGMPRSTAHHHDTVAEARDCQEFDNAVDAYHEWEAAIEKQSEEAMMRHYEDNERVRMETDAEERMAWWMAPVGSA